MIPEETMDWLRKQPANKSYNFDNMRICPAAQFLGEKHNTELPWAIGIRYASVFGTIDGYIRCAATKPWNYGALVERCEEYNKNWKPAAPVSVPWDPYS